MKKVKTKNNGFSLVEVIVVSAILVLVFGGLFVSFDYSLKLINISRAKLTAISIANSRMEYFRSLPYDRVGVLSGFPAGTIAQNGTTTLNNIQFSERVRVDYFDDPGDGQVTATTTDSNNISTDYKRVRLEYSWEINGIPGEIFMVSNIIPRSIETNVGGGTVRINVIDENSQLLPGASVRVFNTDTGYNVTSISDVGGSAIFSVLANNNYQAEVNGTIAGKAYSTDRTYVATTSNPNPLVSAFSVLQAGISTLTFQIGELSDLKIKTLSSIIEGSAREDFADLTGVATSSDVAISTGQLVLSGGPSYATSGRAYLLPITPPTLLRWDTIAVGADLPPNTLYKVRVATGTSPGPFTLITEADLPGNTVGFSDSLIDISGLSPVVYPSLVMELILETTDTSLSPLIYELGVYYRESEMVRPNTNFTIVGNKIIGSNAVFAPIYKFYLATSTNASGEIFLPNIEFDVYNLDFSPAFDVAIGCPVVPFVQKAGVDGEIEVLLTANVANTLLVKVVDSTLRPVPGAEVNLSRSGFSSTKYANTCGQVFFSTGVVDQNDYIVTADAPGYSPATVNPFAISGDSLLDLTLNP